MQRRVVVTGLGAVTPLGNDVASTWKGLVEGRSGIGPITGFDASGLEVRIAGEARTFKATDYLEPKEARRMDRFTHFAVVAALEAVRDADLHDIRSNNAEAVGVAIGSGIGGISTIVDQVKVMEQKGPRRVSPFLVPMMILNMAAGQVSIVVGAKGPNISVVSACATSAHSVGEAAEIIARGDAEVMIAGGSEAPVIPIGIVAFAQAQALSTRNDEPEKASRPFDAKRDGFVAAEGGAVMVLESLEHALRRGARIYAELVGYGATADAFHITAPPEGGEGAARSMRMALRKAGLEPQQVDYINAHGTSTPLNDRAETDAIKAVFGEHAYRLAVSSTKSMVGHMLGAAGAIEAIVCVKTIEKGVIPPTINYEHPDPVCDLDYVPNIARHARVDVALSNSLGFGGHNSTLIFRRYTE